jgi:DNA-binding GntR family transcriptional regulator
MEHQGMVRATGGRRPARAPEGGAKPLVGAIEQDISLGRLPPGSWLKQIDLESRYGAKRLDVRQALDLLVARGLVRHVERRGYTVEEFDPERVQQIMEIRAALEVEAATQVIDLIDEPVLQGMQAAAVAFEVALETGDPAEQDAFNRQFHAHMLSKCPNREIVKLLFDLRSRVPVWVIRQRNTHAILRRSALQHFEIIELIRKKDVQALRTLMRAHNLTLGDAHQ